MNILEQKRFNRREYDKKYRAKNMIKLKEYRKEYYLINRLKINSQQKSWIERNPNKWKEIKYSFRQRLRIQVLEMGGGICKCCGEIEKKFLAIDHINGGGKKHRAQFPSTDAYMRHIRDNGFPEYCQILCHNCNLAKGFYGQCPHLKNTINND